MFFSLKSAPLLLLLVIFPLLPLFEGGETATGLFLLHTLVLLSLAVVAFIYSEWIIPRFLIFFLPFLIALILSTLIAPYRYAAFLQLWEYCIAALFAIMVFSLLVRNQTEIERISLYAFLLASVVFVVTAALDEDVFRSHGAFINPNDFAAFGFLLFLLGLFQYERQTDRFKKNAILVLLLILGLCMAGASSRTVFVGAALLLGASLWRRKAPRLLVLTLAVILLLLGGGLLMRFTHIADPFQYYRLKIWRHSLLGVAEDPYIGIGLNMLEFRALKFNFPADVEVGRYSRVARSADNQYLQILTETGFLGLLTFLTGWTVLYLSLRKTPDRFFYLKYSFVIFSVMALFDIILAKTSLLLLFLFLILVPLLFAPGRNVYRISFGAVGRIAVVTLLFLLFVFAVFLPYMAHVHFQRAVRAENRQDAERHFNQALRYNPYQPYYRFVFLKPVVDSNRELDTPKLLYLLQVLNESIALNPLDPEFYIYKARVLERLLNQTERWTFYTRTVSAFQAALDRSPYNVFHRFEFASFLLRHGRLDHAEAELQKAVELEPAFLNARLLLSEVQFLKNDLQQARAEFEEEEKYNAKYESYRRTRKENYIQALLYVNAEQRERIRKLLFSRS